jgi:outer membrane PBP1 activator LpoA protein
VYNGTPNPQLEGVIFADMPWILAPDEKAAQAQAALSGHMNKQLYALGVDAYYLLPRLQQLSSYQWQGQTGHLSVNNRGIIHRDQLSWARFVNGKPQLLD